MPSMEYARKGVVPPPATHMLPFQRMAVGDPTGQTPFIQVFPPFTLYIIVVVPPDIPTIHIDGFHPIHILVFVGEVRDVLKKLVPIPTS